MIVATITRYIANNKRILTGLGLALLFLTLEAIVHVAFLHQHANVLDELITADLHESLLRLFIMFLFLWFAVRVQIEEKKRAARDREIVYEGIEWKRTFDTMPDFIAIIDPEYRFLRINKAMARRLDADPESLIGSICYEHIHGTENPPSYCPHRKLLADHQEHTTEIHEERLGGDYAVTVTPLLDQDGRLIGCTHVARDISARKRAEAELRDNNAALQRQLRFTETLLKAEPIAVFFKDAGGRYLGCNEAFSKILGVTPEEIVGKTVFDLWPADLAEVYFRQDNALLANPCHQTYEFKVRKAGGELIDVIFNKDVFLDESGVVGGIVGTLLDITERKQAEEQIARMNENLEQRVEERTAELAALTTRLRNLSARLMDARESERRHISHELHDEIGQLLTGVKLSLESLRRKADACTAAGLADIQGELNTLMVRVRDLSLNLRPSLLDSLGLLPTLQWHFKRYTEQTGIRVHFDHQSSIPRFSTDIETALYRTVQEALTNVARHAGVDAVSVVLSITEKEAIAMIEDRGAGFDVKTAVESSRSVGLTGMYERVEDFGGTLSIQSAKGSGTKLTVSLPLVRMIPFDTKLQNES